jgi:O-antigen/teichoic acid export membrane protein
MPASKDHPGRSLIWALIESGGLSVLSLAVLLVVARLAGPGELGAFAIALGIVQILAMVVEMLLHDAIIQRPQLTPDHLHTAFWACLGLGAGFSTACWLAAGPIGQVFESEQVAALLPIIGLSLVMSGAGCVPIAVLRREVNFRPLALRSLCGRLCGAIIAVVMAAAHYGVWSLVAQHLIQVFVSTLLVWPASPWRPAFSFSWARLRELFSFGVLSVGTRLVWTGSGRLFTLLVGNYLGVTAVGYLNIAQRVVDTLFDLLAGGAHNLALPIFSRRQEDKPSMVRAYKQATEFATIATQPLFGGLAVCASPIIAVLLGDTWLPASPLVSLLAIGAMLQFLFLFGPTTLTALGRPGLVFGASLLNFIFVVAAFFLIHPQDVVEATALWASRIVIGGPILHLMISRLLNSSPWLIVKISWVPLGATIIMGIALKLIDDHWLHGVSPVVQLAILVPLGAVIYGAALAVAGRASVVRLLDFATAAIRHRPSLGS